MTSINLEDKGLGKVSKSSNEGTCEHSSVLILGRLATGLVLLSLATLMTSATSRCRGAAYFSSYPTFWRKPWQSDSKSCRIQGTIQFLWLSVRLLHKDIAFTQFGLQALLLALAGNLSSLWKCRFIIPTDWLNTVIPNNLSMRSSANLSI